ncbi:hypothetical protein EZS27_005552 [termite gut metagenome]|uniref:DUF4276 family protein n=1 Tax=termite gut metagenome TaxID=433724 RepID=A0A5J4SNB5_9ZZZZ
MKVILNVLCEGQTEERFVNKVLKNYLKEFGIVVKAQILVTNRKKSCQGGMLSYNQVKRDLSTWMKQCENTTNEKYYYTTMFDFYALPNDFPGYAEAFKASDCYERIQLLERGFTKDISSPHFIPYIQLHEFETLVFCGLDYLLDDYPDIERQIENLKKVVETKYFNNPELINTRPETAPSRRIIKEFENYHHYNKPKSGELVTSKLGIDKLKEKCKHFKEWVEKLEKIALSPQNNRTSVTSCL